MKRLKEAFLEASKYEKCALIIGFFSSIIVIVCGLLQIFNIWDGAIVICEIFLGISMIAQAVLQWKRNKGLAIFSLCVAIFIFAVACFILLVR